MRLSLATTFIRKDWCEFRKPIFVLTLGMLVPIAMLWFGVGRPDLARGMLAGVMLAGPFIYSQSCFLNERRQGTLLFILFLPVTRRDFVLSKFASLFSMILFTVNAPGVLLGDPRFLFQANAVALLLSSVFMTATVVSDKPWAPQLPFWVIIIGTIPAEPVLRKFFPQGLNVVPWIAAHRSELAAAAYVLTAVIVSTAAWIFDRYDCGLESGS